MVSNSRLHLCLTCAFWSLAEVYLLSFHFQKTLGRRRRRRRRRRIACDTSSLGWGRPSAAVLPALMMIREVWIFLVFIRFSPGCSGSPVITFVIWKKKFNRQLKEAGMTKWPSPSFSPPLTSFSVFSLTAHSQATSGRFFPWMRRTFCRTEFLLCFLLSSLGWNRFSPGCSGSPDVTFVTWKTANQSTEGSSAN